MRALSPGGEKKKSPFLPSNDLEIVNMLLGAVGQQLGVTTAGCAGGGINHLLPALTPNGVRGCSCSMGR